MWTKAALYYSVDMTTSLSQIMYHVDVEFYTDVLAT